MPLALGAGSPATRTLPLHPKLFLGLTLFDCDRVVEARAAYRAALDDEFGSAWWLSDTLVADAQACFAIGEWEDALPGLIASGEAAKEKHHPLLLSQSLAYRAVIATAKGEHRTARELLADVPPLVEGDALPYNAGVLAFASAGLMEAEGDQRSAVRGVADLLAVRVGTRRPLLPPLRRRRSGPSRAGARSP